MEELSSYQLHLHQPLQTNQVMKLYKLVSKSNQNIYLHQNHLIADGGHLPKLMSFFLLMDIEEPLVMIIDGEEVEETFQEIEDSWQENIAEANRRTKYPDSIINSNISIFV
ncbi:hypothetical protein SAMN05216353_1327 [Halobacillus alkaliphilus]|uniref:Condensation domain-containing protein n=1 Tax=Halobacillus alkaliphilus TaxID=396056 RepID=A0A1I2QPM4_9BACI|nr:hypothetical protein [Halobacillus alkaliphilus]SFG28197.1 hypothetical protein SAMN05216353_1327 [Halobacillus alkaliphilus]